MITMNIFNFTEFSVSVMLKTQDIREVKNAKKNNLVRVTCGHVATISVSFVKVKENLNYFLYYYYTNI